MNNKIYNSIKNRNKLIDEKIERNNNKIKELEENNKKLLEEKDKNEKEIMEQVITILKIKPYEFMERFLNGEDVQSIIESEEEKTVQNQFDEKSNNTVEESNE